MSIFNDFLKNLKKLGMEWYGRYYSVYPALVINNIDPEFRGRLLVQMPTVFGQIPLPDFVPPTGQSLAGIQTGMFMLPYIGQWVDIVFENGDPDYPLYTPGGNWGIGELPVDFTAAYSFVRGIVFQNQTKIIVDETPGNFNMRFQLPDQSGIIVSGIPGSGSITITDNNQNVVSLNPTGITVTDKNSNLITTAANGMNFNAGSTTRFTATQAGKFTLTNGSGELLEIISQLADALSQTNKALSAAVTATILGPQPLSSFGVHQTLDTTVTQLKTLIDGMKGV